MRKVEEMGSGEYLVRETNGRFFDRIFSSSLEAEKYIEEYYSNGGCEVWFRPFRVWTNIANIKKGK